MPDLLDQLFQLHERNAAVDNINQLIRQIIRSHDVIGKVHPLGFYLYNLGSRENGYTARLHVWDEDSYAQNDDLIIHNHNFSFKSLLLTGQLRNHTYQIRKNPSNPEGFLYTIGYKADSSVLDMFDSGYNINLINISNLCGGEFYYQQAHEFHKTVASRDVITSTLLITKPQVTSNHYVFSEKNQGAHIEFKRALLPHDKNILLLERLWSSLL